MQRPQKLLLVGAIPVFLLFGGLEKPEDRLAF